MGFIDYAELKTRFSIHDAIQKLGLELKPTGHQLRGFCPKCMQGGDRALVITPEKSLFYCFAGKTGGDQLALVAHLKDMKTNEAANWLAGTVPQNKTKACSPTVPPAPPTKGFDPEKYVQRLDPAHEALAPIGLSPETLQHFRAGYAGTGTNRGRLAIAVEHQGAMWFVGRAIGSQQPTLAFPNGFPDGVIWNAQNVTPGELYVFKDVLDAMRAFEAGIENVVAFLSEGTTAAQLEALAGLMDAKSVERAFF